VAEIGVIWPSYNFAFVILYLLTFYFFLHENKIYKNITKICAANSWRKLDASSYNSIFVILQERSEVKGLQNVHLLCRWMEACICARESWLTFDGMTRPEIFRSSQTLNKEFLGVGSRLASRQEPWGRHERDSRQSPSRSGEVSIISRQRFAGFREKVPFK